MNESSNFTVMMTPEERADHISSYAADKGRPKRPSVYQFALDQIRQAEAAAREGEQERCKRIAMSEASETPIIAPGTNAAWDECARTIAAAIDVKQPSPKDLPTSVEELRDEKMQESNYWGLDEGW